MLTEFPVIHTNVWDAIWAVPVTLIVIFLIRLIFKLRASWFSTVATITGLILSIFISHPGDLSAGIFMGLFYGGTAIGIIYSFEKTFYAYRSS